MCLPRLVYDQLVCRITSVHLYEQLCAITGPQLRAYTPEQYAGVC